MPARILRLWSDIQLSDDLHPKFLKISITIFAVVLGAVGCATVDYSRVISEHEFIAKQECASKTGVGNYDGTRTCYKWITDAVNSKELSENLTDFLLTLYNSDQLELQLVRAENADIDGVRSIFAQNIAQLDYWDPRLDNLLCEINRDRGLFFLTGVGCKRPRVPAGSFDDSTSHVAGYEFVNENEVQWGDKPGIGGFVTIPKLNLAEIARSQLLLVPNNQSLKEFIVANPEICRGFLISRRAGNDIGSIDYTLGASSIDACVERYVNGNPQISERRADEISEVPLFLRSLFFGLNPRALNDLARPSNAPRKALDSLSVLESSTPARFDLRQFEAIFVVEGAPDPRRDFSTLYRHYLQRVGSLRVIAQLESIDGELYEFDPVLGSFKTDGVIDKRALAKTVTSSTAGVTAINTALAAGGTVGVEAPNTASCITAAFNLRNLEKEEIYKRYQSEIFEIVNHPYTRLNLSSTKSLVSALRGNIQTNESNIGFLDVDPSGVEHCENPVSPLSDREACGRIVPRQEKKGFAYITQEHGLSVSAVAAAPINTTSSEIQISKGLVGINPCAHTKFENLNWDAIADISVLRSKMWAILQDSRKVWNISASYPSNKNEFNFGVASDIRGEFGTVLNKLFVVSSGTVPHDDDKPLQPSLCWIYPACLSNDAELAESFNILTVVGLEKNDDEIDVWRGFDGAGAEVASATSPLFDIGAIAGGVTKIDENKQSSYTPLYTAGVIAEDLGSDEDIIFSPALLPVEGVSFAVPQVSATASLLYQLHPNIVPAYVKTRLIACSRYFPRLQDRLFGGLLDIECSLDTNIDRVKKRRNPDDLYRVVITGLWGKSDSNLDYTKLEAVTFESGGNEVRADVGQLLKVQRETKYQNADEAPRVTDRFVVFHFGGGMGLPLERSVGVSFSKKQDIHVEIYVESEKAKEYQCIPIGEIEEIVWALAVPFDPTMKLSPRGRQAEINRIIASSPGGNGCASLSHPD